jgi:acyl dehydratase
MRRDLTDPTDLRDFADPEASLKAPVYENIEVPEDFGPVDLVVDEYKARRFAFAQGDSLPTGARTAPIGVLANDLLQMFTLHYAASQVVGLHTEEELWFDQPVPVDEPVTLTARYTEKYERRGQGHVVMVAEALDAQGRTLIRHRGVEIMRTAPAEVAGRGSAEVASSPRVRAEWDERLPLVDQVTDDVPAGSGLVPLHCEATLEQMALFSRLGEGVANIHSDLRTARRAGLDLPIMQGQQLVCHLAGFLDDRIGPSFQYGGWLRVKFLKPVRATERFSLEGAVRGFETADGTRAACDVWVRREDGGLAAVGWTGGPLK